MNNICKISIFLIGEADINKININWNLNNPALWKTQKASLSLTQ